MSYLNRNHYDKLIKLLILGDSGVGKSCLLLRFADDAFTTNFITTIGIDFKIRTIEVEGKKIKLQIWDTAGQERFRTITRGFYRGADGILLVYAINDEQSFIHIKNWINEIEKERSDNKFIKVLIGNKCDLDRCVETQQGRELANLYDMEFFETSAKDNKLATPINDVLTKTSQKILHKMEKAKSSSDLLLNGQNKRSLKEKCCN